MLTQKQKAILNYIGNTEKKKSQVVNRFQSWYYGNESKHIGRHPHPNDKKKDCLERVKKGIYKRGSKSQMKDTTAVINNQLTIF